MTKTTTRPQVRKPETREKITMNDQELKVRVAVRKNTTRPDNTVKTDVILYSHGAGRINYWVSLEDSRNYDIISYYFLYDMAEIKLFDEKNEYKIIDI